MVFSSCLISFCQFHIDSFNISPMVCYKKITEFAVLVCGIVYQNAVALVSFFETYLLRSLFLLYFHKDFLMDKHKFILKVFIWTLGDLGNRLSYISHDPASFIKSLNTRPGIHKQSLFTYQRVFTLSLMILF